MAAGAVLGYSAGQNIFFELSNSNGVRKLKVSSKTLRIISILYNVCGAGHCCEEVAVRIRAARKI